MAKPGNKGNFKFLTEVFPSIFLSVIYKADNVYSLKPAKQPED